MGTTTFDHQRRAADERREALNWLSRRLSWENRLGQLRPSADKTEAGAPTKQAA
ncbi:MAG TPA: hypothetical protein VL769_11995 [Acidimicrobiia bacterium]|jgi:hypothetical protein|nr:hypothetical protein [Acidimicrobiia bacterium]